LSTVHAAIIMAAAIVVELVVALLAARWLKGRTYSLAAITVGLMLFLFTGFTALVLTSAVEDGFNRRGPAGEAIGWAHHSGAFVTVQLPDESRPQRHPAVMTGSGVRVEVSPGAVLAVGSALAYSCPPSDSPEWGYDDTVPACKQDSVVVSCAKGCVHPNEYMWWARPAAVLIIGIACVPFFWYCRYWMGAKKR
jgi:hypothetical protein